MTAQKEATLFNNKTTVKTNSFKVDFTLVYSLYIFLSTICTNITDLPSNKK